MFQALVVHNRPKPHPFVRIRVSWPPEIVNWPKGAGGGRETRRVARPPLAFCTSNGVAARVALGTRPEVPLGELDGQ